MVSIKISRNHSHKRNIARHDYPVVDGDEIIGKVTSGSWSPSLSIPIALAYVPTELSKVGSKYMLRFVEN